MSFSMWKDGQIDAHDKAKLLFTILQACLKIEFFKRIYEQYVAFSAHQMNQ